MTKKNIKTDEKKEKEKIELTVKIEKYPVYYYPLRIIFLKIGIIKKKLRNR